VTTETKHESRLVPLREGMFEMPGTIDGTPRLLGQKCGNCNEVFATTQRVFCANCHEEALESVKLGTRGEVVTYTIVHQQLKGALVEVPYVIARVRLPEDVTVQTVLADVDPKDVTVDMPVEICLKKLSEDDAGNPIVNFFFRPAKT
jgi:uncharacterized OB-fold protein